MNIHAKPSPSERLFRGLRVTPGDHTVLKSNLEYFNSQLERPIEDTAQLGERLENSSSVLETRWLNKIKRDTSSPYTDGEAVSHLHTLDSELTYLARHRTASFPTKLYVAGSVNKGYFGGNSDIDSFAEGLIPDSELKELGSLPGFGAQVITEPDGHIAKQRILSDSGIHCDFYPKEEFVKKQKYFGAYYVVDVSQVARGNSKLPETVQASYQARGLSVDVQPRMESLAS